MVKAAVETGCTVYCQLSVVTGCTTYASSVPKKRLLGMEICSIADIMIAWKVTPRISSGPHPT
jgi:hypothetical protein